MKKYYIVLVALALTAMGARAPKSFDLTIERKVSNTSCTMGYLIVGNEVICYTLELPWADNQNNMSCIPAGTYNGIIRYDKTDGWKIELDNVPGRSKAQIHMGNYSTQVEGCMLVGASATLYNCDVVNSSTACSNLRKVLYGSEMPGSTPKKRISVTFK